MDTQSVIAVDTAALPWEERFNEKLGRALYRKNLITDPDTGMEVRLVRYPAGVINIRHTHPRPRHVRAGRDAGHARRSVWSRAASSGSPKARSWSTEPPPRAM